MAGCLPSGLDGQVLIIVKLQSFPAIRTSERRKRSGLGTSEPLMSVNTSSASTDFVLVII